MPVSRVSLSCTGVKGGGGGGGACSIVGIGAGISWEVPWFEGRVAASDDWHAVGDMRDAEMAIPPVIRANQRGIRALFLFPNRSFNIR
jgi:hypothetical protein